MGCVASLDEVCCLFRQVVISCIVAFNANFVKTKRKHFKGDNCFKSLFLDVFYTFFVVVTSAVILPLSIYYNAENVYKFIFLYACILVGARADKEASKCQKKDITG